jgi:hypothetical protein
MFRTASWRRHQDGKVYRKWVRHFHTLFDQAISYDYWMKFGRLRKYSLSCDCEACKYAREQRKYKRTKAKEEELKMIEEETANEGL